MRATLLTLLLGCASPDPQWRICHAHATCDLTAPYDETDRQCLTEAQARERVRSFTYVCEEATFIYGCGTWSCLEDCEATDVQCTP